MDFKSAAAGDIENLGQRESAGNPRSLVLESGPNLALAADVLEHLETKLLTSLRQDQKEQWIKELSHVSPKKLLTVANDFSGPHISGVWDFIKKLPNEPDDMPSYLKQLPEPKSSLSRDFFAHWRSMDEIQFKPTVKHEDDPAEYQRQRAEWLKKHRKHEKASLIALHEKYPRAGFDRCLNDPGFDGI